VERPRRGCGLRRRAPMAHGSWLTGRARCSYGVPRMQRATSADGTAIAFEKLGNGPALILVGGAFCDHRARTAGKPLAAELASHFSVYCVDRRGRGDSGDTAPYAVSREIEDLAALITEAGGSAHLYGHSSGAVLALEAAAAGLAVNKLALYEPPIVLESLRPLPPPSFADDLSRLVAEGRRSEACELFLTKAVAVPEPVVSKMKQAPVWSNLQLLAHTLTYDARLTADAPQVLARARAVSTPALLVDGAKSPAWMRGGVERLAGALLRARHLTLPEQDHDVNAKVLAPVLLEFFGA
jgi:pimeloyl-ACP methyl ester carboxylesterase